MDLQSTTRKVGGLLVLIAAVGLLITGLLYINSRKNQKNSGSNNQNSATQNETAGTVPDQGLSRSQISTATAENVKFSALPPRVREALLAEIAKQTPACVKDGKIIDGSGQPVDPDTTFASVGSAIVPIGCDGGGAGLFAKNKESGWQFIESTQSSFSCDAIFTYAVPKALLEKSTSRADCYNKTTDKVQSYDEAMNERFY